jgi:hypothetical protein
MRTSGQAERMASMTFAGGASSAECDHTMIVQPSATRAPPGRESAELSGEDSEARRAVKLPGRRA